jgi:hypothetical protein
MRAPHVPNTCPSDDCQSEKISVKRDYDGETTTLHIRCHKCGSEASVASRVNYKSPIKNESSETDSDGR